MNDSNNNKLDFYNIHYLLNVANMTTNTGVDADFEECSHPSVGILCAMALADHERRRRMPALHDVATYAAPATPHRHSPRTRRR